MNSRKWVLAVYLFVVATMTALPAAGEVPAGLTPAEPVVCTGNQDVELVGRYIETRGNGVEIRGNCTVEIRNSHIAAGGYGVLVLFNGNAEISGSTIEGGKGALQVDGNGDIAFRGSVVRGGLGVRGNGEITDEGGNTIAGKKGTAVPAREPETVIVGAGGSSVVVGPDGVRIESGGSRVVVSDGWREEADAVRVYDTEKVLVELGATTEGELLRLQLAGDVLFDFDSTVIRPDAAVQLEKVAHVLRRRSAGEIVMTGHTDSEGTDEYNQKLSEDRAVSVMRWLHEKESIPAELLVARGLGEKKPVAYNTMPDGSDNPEGRAKNRRVEISFAAGEPVPPTGETKVMIGPGGVSVKGGGSDVVVGPGGVKVQGGGSDVTVGAGGVAVESVKGAPMVEELSPLTETCAAICDRWPDLTAGQMECVTGAVALRGYELLGNLACTGVESASHCALCWQTIKVSEKDCGAVRQLCLQR